MSKLWDLKNEKPSAASLSRLLQGSRHKVVSPESRGIVLHLSYSPWRAEQAHFPPKSTCVASTVQMICLLHTQMTWKKEQRKSKAIVNAVVAVWPGISARAKSSSREGCEHGLVCLDLDRNLKPYQRLEERRREEHAVNWSSLNGALPTGASGWVEQRAVCDSRNRMLPTGA